MSDMTPLPTPATTHKTITLKSRLFRQQREAGWRELDQMLLRVEKRNLDQLTSGDLQRLPLLYRAALSSLSVARAIALDRHLVLYLEDLALRGYLAVYGPRKRWIDTVRRFLGHGFGDAVRTALPHIALSFLCVAAGVVAGFVLTLHDEAWFGSFVPGGLAHERGPASTRQDLLDHEIYAPWPGFFDSFITFASFLFQHNSIVSVMCFSLGIMAGVPTIMLLIYQGLTLGAFLALHTNRGLTLDILGWVAIHGTTELSAIIIAGAGGLFIAEKILFPGRYRPADNLALHGETASRLAVGAITMLIVAAILEGGFRQLVQNTYCRLFIGIGIWTLWIIYFAAPWRRRKAA